MAGYSSETKHQEETNMGRTHKDTHDLDDDFLEIDVFEDKDATLDHFSEDLYLIKSPPKRSGIKGSRKKVNKMRKSISTESDDWKDPEDDIMYGFEE